MFKWSNTFEGMIKGSFDELYLPYWKIFFYKYYFSISYRGSAHDFKTKLYEYRRIVKIGSKIALTDEYGEAIMGYAREYVHLERLFLIIQEKVDYKPYIDLDWCKIVSEAERDLKIWIDEEYEEAQHGKRGNERLPHIVKSPLEWIEEDAQKGERESLWGELWYENEIACFYGDSNIGKSVYAMQIACEIAKKRRVLYLDYEMDEGTFRKRYSDLNGCVHTFPTNLYRAQVNPDSLLTRNYIKDIFQHLEKLIKSHLFKVIIIDNLTYLTGGDNRGDVAAKLIYRLKQIMSKYRVSFLIVAHTKKRDLGSALSSEDLMANRRFYHFLDSAFAINRSGGEGSTLYIKQIKCRNREFCYGSDRVISGNLKRIGSFLCFEQYRVEPEAGLLRKEERSDREWVIEKVKKLHEEKKSYAEIATEVGVSRTKVCRILRGE